MLEVKKEELKNDEMSTLSRRMKWKIDGIIIMKLLEILMESYFKMIDGKIYYQRDGLPVDWEVY